MNSPADELVRVTARLRRDRWLDTQAGGLPQVPIRDVLPTAGEEWRFRLVAIRGAAGDADVVYCCLKDAADAYAWEVCATG